MDASVIFGGEDAIDLWFKRTKSCGGGYIVTVEALPMVEDFMRNLGDGTTYPVTSYGHLWASIDGVELVCYRATNNLTLVSGEKFDSPGTALVQQDHEYNRNMVNLSFLKLKGISNPGGVSFIIKEPIGLARLREIRDLALAAATRFFDEYVKPIDLRATVVMKRSERSLIE